MGPCRRSTRQSRDCCNPVQRWKEEEEDDGAAQISSTDICDVPQSLVEGYITFLQSGDGSLIHTHTQRLNLTKQPETICDHVVL